MILLLVDLEAVQVAFVPPPDPWHVHVTVPVVGKVGFAGFAVPVEQSDPVNLVAVEGYTIAAVPQVPLTLVSVVAGPQQFPVSQVPVATGLL